MSLNEDTAQTGGDGTDGYPESHSSQKGDDKQKQQLDQFLMSYNNHINTLGSLAN